MEGKRRPPGLTSRNHPTIGILSDVVVIGAGAFGAWTAHHLAEAGAHVTLVDAYPARQPRSSWGDESRILRCGYGPRRGCLFASPGGHASCGASSRRGTTQASGCGTRAACSGWLRATMHTGRTLATLQRGHYAVEGPRPGCNPLSLSSPCCGRCRTGDAGTRGRCRDGKTLDSGADRRALAQRSPGPTRMGVQAIDARTSIGSARDGWDGAARHYFRVCMWSLAAGGVS